MFRTLNQALSHEPFAALEGCIDESLEAYAFCPNAVVTSNPDEVAAHTPGCMDCLKYVSLRLHVNYLRVQSSPSS